MQYKIPIRVIKSTCNTIAYLFMVVLLSVMTKEIQLFYDGFVLFYS